MKLLWRVKAFVCDRETLWLWMWLPIERSEFVNEQWSNMAADANESVNEPWNYVFKWNVCNHKFQPQREMIVQN